MGRREPAHPLRRGLSAGLGLGAALLALAPASAAETTLEATVGVDKSHPFKRLFTAPGERHRRLEAGLGGAKPNRAERRRSLAYFAQLTDPQLADEMSPGRVEVFDPVGGAFSAAWRPQEAMGTQVLDQIVRGVNTNRDSPVRQGGARGRARLGFALLTGDQPDNQELNETRWYLGILDGGSIDPFSGTPIGPSNPCASASPEEAAALDAAVADRRYTGVQDYDDYPGQVTERYQGFWDPDVAPPGGGPYAAFPRYPGLMDRAQRPFEATGLRVPWYTSRGNHDGLIQGNIPASIALLVNLAPGCSKIFPGPNFDPASISGHGNVIDQILDDPALLADLFSDARPVPPDPDRRFISPVEYKQLHDGRDHDHGFGFVDPEQNAASAGTASYYAFTPAPGLRLIALDTVAEGGGANGNLDDPQYEWLERELDASSSVSYSEAGKLERDSDPNRLIVVYGHHTLATMNNPTPDEDAGACTDPPLPGCDADPRNSRPIHLGVGGEESLRSLLFRYPNVIAAVTGHTHHNAVKAYTRRSPRRGFWQVNTASHVDFPQQSRLVEIMDNRDGTLSIFGTMVDQAAPAKTPPEGEAGALSDRQLASISRRLAANDPQRVSVTINGGTGRKRDRNVEMVIRDPRLLAKR